MHLTLVRANVPSIGGGRPIQNLLIDWFVQLTFWGDNKNDDNNKMIYKASQGRDWWALTGTGWGHTCTL